MDNVSIDELKRSENWDVKIDNSNSILCLPTKEGHTKTLIALHGGGSSPISMAGVFLPDCGVCPPNFKIVLP